MKFIFGIIILALVFLSPLLHPGFYESHDGDAHVARFAAYYHAFQDNNFPPRWAGNLNFGYGTPIFIFYYPLPGYLASMLHFIGINFQDSFKILMISVFIGAPLAFYLWMKMHFNKTVSVVGALLYGFAPYHFLNLYVRGDVAELMAFAFIPLVFWAIEKVLATRNLLFILLGSVFYALLILSHNGVSLMFSPVFLLYIIFRSNTIKIFLGSCGILLLGLINSAFFWVPALYEGKYVNAHIFIGNMYQDHFPSFMQLIISPWGFGSDVQKTGGLSPQLGILYFCFVLVSLILFFREKSSRKILGMWLAIFIASIFIILPPSNSVWQMIPTLRLYEFPWRFVGLASFAASVLACFVLSKITDKKLFIVIFIVLIITSLPLVQVKKFVSYNDTYYESFTGTTYYHGEANPLWTAGDPSSFAKSQIELIGGKGTIGSIEKNNNSHTFVVHAEDTVTLLDNTHFYPGWTVFVDKVATPIQFQDPNHRGSITFQVPPGKHTINVVFQETKLRLFVDVVSLISLGIVILLLMYLILVKKNKSIL